jgi:hypothetical protein
VKVAGPQCVLLFCSMNCSPGIRAPLGLDESKYSIEQIAAKNGTSPAYIPARWLHPFAWDT